MARKKKRLIKIDVTTKHIKTGQPENESWCPIALAIREKLSIDPSDDGAVEVDGYEIKVEADNAIGRMRTPARASTFVENFDDNQTVKPFSFILKLEP